MLLGFFVFNAQSAFAYGVETHGFLTKAVVDFYNLNFSKNKISDELANYLVDGARLEDNVPRYFNHFYDPVNNRGLADKIYRGMASKLWSQDEKSQTALLYKVFPQTEASLLTAVQIAKIQPTFSKTNFTWQKAIDLYAKGEKEQALFALGHILHLIEDASVPDHTRNDAHPPFDDGGSPYENWTHKFDLKNPDTDLGGRLKNKKPIGLDNLNAYFDGIANYSNNNFYSKDSIELYPAPVPKKFIQWNTDTYGIYNDENGDYKLIRVEKSLLDIISSGKIKLDKNVATIDTPPVLLDYWSRLSTKAVQYGAGIINLFFKEAEAARQKYLTEKVQRPFLATLIDGFNNIFGDGEVRDIADTVNEFKLVTEIPIVEKKQETSNKKKEENTGTIPTEIVPLPLQSVKPIQVPLPAPEIETELVQLNLCGFNTAQSPSRQGVIINEVAWMGSANSPSDEWIELKNISGGEIDLDGWQMVDLGEQIKIQLSGKLPAGGLYLLERTDDNSVPGVSADQIYKGALANVGEGLRFFNKNCGLVDEVMAAPDWPAGNNDYKKTMERASDFSWRNYSGDGQNGIYGTPKAENSPGTVSINNFGGGGGGMPASINNQQQTTSLTSTSLSAKILISEIQVTAGAGKTEYDFIELYNPNDFQVNLNDYRLVKRTQAGTSDTSIKSWTTDVFILARGYYLWTNSSYADIPVVPDATTASTISNDNGAAIRFGAADTGVIIDSVAWGGAQNVFIEGSVFPTNPGANQSIQRKFHPSTSSGFIDTDNNAEDFEIQSCPSPKTQSRNCATANQAPSAFFVYTPQNPSVGDSIVFNAASSTDPDDSIAFYQWDFGDGATTTTAQPTVAHSYSVANNYLIQLTVFDNQNLLSTVASATVSVSPALALSTNVNHIVISEIQVAGIDAGDEFIELYNPTEGEIDLSGWSIQYLSGSANSTDDVFKKNFEVGNKIPAKGFFLTARNKNTSGADGYNGNKIPNLSHRTFSMSGASTGAKIFLMNDQEKITGFDDANIIDKLDYSFSVPPAGQSLERKASQSSVCLSAQGTGEYLGNGCDTDNDTNDFENRAAPNPQNSQSLTEPRSAPAAVQNLNISYVSSDLELIFNWDVDSALSYQITDVGGELPVILNQATTTGSTKKISAIGREYKFEITATDAEGLSSSATQTTVNVSSLINSLSFYRNPRPTAPSDYVLEFDWQDYPFVPVKFKHLASGQEVPNNWHVVVFYYNQDAPVTDDIFWIDLAGNAAYKSWGLIAPGGLKIKYPNCLGSNYQTGGAALILPDGPNECSALAGNHASYGLNWNQLEDNHLLLEVVDDNFLNSVPVANQDYVTLAFYAYQPGYEPNNYGIKLVATDKTKYYFQDDGPGHQPPTPPDNIGFDFDAALSLLKITWDQSTDADTLDSLISYLVDFVGDSISAATNFIEISVEPAVAYDFELSAKDDLGNLSDAIAESYTVPDIPLPYELTDVSWGHLGNPDSVSLDLEFNEYPFMDVGAPSAMVFFLNQTPPINYSFLDDDYRNGANMGGSNNFLKLSYFPCDFNGAWIDKRTVGGAIFNNADCPTNSSLAMSSLLLAKLGSDDIEFTAEVINDQEFSESDYLTIGFYELGPRDQNGKAYFTNIANYNKKIYFQP